MIMMIIIIITHTRTLHLRCIELQHYNYSYSRSYITVTLKINNMTGFVSECGMGTQHMALFNGMMISHQELGRPITAMDRQVLGSIPPLRPRM